MDTGYPALIAELPRKENNMRLSGESDTSDSKNPPATTQIYEETSSPPTTQTPS